MRTLFTAMLFALAASPALANDAACDDATFLLDTLGDLFVTVEFTKVGVRDQDDVATDADAVVKYGGDAAARATEEKWRDDYLHALGLAIERAGAIAARGGALVENDESMLRRIGSGLRVMTAIYCDLEDIPVFIEPGGLACPSVLKYAQSLETHLPSFEDNPLAAAMMAATAREASESVIATQWPAEAAGAMELAATTLDGIAKGDKPANADNAAAIVALTSTVIAGARPICNTTKFPDLAAGT